MAKSQNYIPRSDAEFDVWQENIMAQLKGDKSKFALSNESDAELSSLQTTWQARNVEHLEAQSKAAAARVAKDAQRGEYEAALRKQVRQTQNAPGVSDADRALLRITIRDTQPTAPAPPSTRPVVQVDTSQRLGHGLDVTDEFTPTSRSKPKGVTYYEVWVKVGDSPPVDESELRFLDTGTTSTFNVKYTGRDAGKTAHYMVRWVNSRKEKGPWSQTVSATITG
ncbi:MAG TPA: hypothetical protein VGC89_07635 [Pyrinomonadaceae bacterium]